MDLSGRIEVTSKSGLTMTLEAAGEDRDGHQLWRQVAPSVSDVMRSAGQTKQYGPRPRIATGKA